MNGAFAPSGVMRNHRGMHSGQALSVPSFDAVTLGRQTSGVSLTFAHTVAVQSNRALVVAMSYRGNTNPTATATGITYAGVAMTKVRRDSNTDRKTEIWYLVAPATGANNVIVTWSADPEGQIVAAVSYYGVNQVSPIAANNGATGNSQNPAVAVTAATHQLVVAVGAIYPNGIANLPLTPGTGTTERWEDDENAGGLGNVQGFGGEETGAGGSTTIDWTHPGGADTWAMSAIVLTA